MKIEEKYEKLNQQDRQRVSKYITLVKKRRLIKEKIDSGEIEKPIVKSCHKCDLLKICVIHKEIHYSLNRLGNSGDFQRKEVLKTLSSCCEYFAKNKIKRGDK